MLDTFVILNDKDGFEDAVLKVLEHVSFDTDARVQVFEVTIRVLGGLVGDCLLFWMFLPGSTCLPSEMHEY